MARIQNSTATKAAKAGKTSKTKSETTRKPAETRSRKDRAERTETKARENRKARNSEVEAPRKAAKATSGSLIAMLEFVKETSGGAFQFREIDDGGEAVSFKESKVGQIYLRNTKVGKVAPKRITVTVEW